MNFNRVSVKLLKEQDPRFTSIPKEPGIYRWWFPKETAQQLLSSIHGIETNRICKEVIQGEEYWCLYFGIAKDLRQRIRWHACQKHTASAVKHGILSTLRQSISALLQLDQTTSTDKVSELLERCYWIGCLQPPRRMRRSSRKERSLKGIFPLTFKRTKALIPLCLPNSNPYVRSTKNSTQ